MKLVIKYQNILSLVLASSLIWAIGCNSESVESEDIRTSGMWVKMEADGQADERTRVVVELNVGGEFGTNVVLSSGEYLEAVAAGVTKRMAEDTDFLDIDYQAYMDTNTSDTEVNIRFYRNSGENIVESRAILPTSFVITSPLSSEDYSLQETVVLAWTPEIQDGSTHFFSTITCINTEGETTSSSSSEYINDNGVYEYDISTSRLFANGTAGLNTAQPCTMAFTLQRKRFGNIDPRFGEGGTFKATQTRKVEGVTLHL